ncbi:MAG: ABC transporter permease [Acidimicrobiia bacterium]|nr:ABC transporter permease [Acidimicrobiia bacterium]
MVARSLLYVETRARTYRHVWKASVFSNFLSPVLFLAAMGVGLGSLVDGGARSSGLDGVSYLNFLAPGLLAASAMLTATGEGSFPVVAGIKWTKTYHAALATPIGVPDLVVGHLAWIAVRLAMVCGAFATVAVAFGAMPPGRAAAAVVPAVLTGLAFAAATTAYAAALKHEMGLTLLFRFGVTPLFLFSGTFFPVEQLPGWMQPAAYVVPLWHGVEMARAMALGIPYEVSPLLSVAYLASWIVAGAGLSVFFFRRRLRP